MAERLIAPVLKTGGVVSETFPETIDIAELLGYNVSDRSDFSNAFSNTFPIGKKWRITEVVITGRS